MHLKLYVSIELIPEVEAVFLLQLGERTLKQVPELRKKKLYT